MQTISELEVYQAGKLTVIGFGGREVLDHMNLTECRDEIAALIRSHDVSTLAFDLTGVRLIPSGLLGLLASIKRHGVDVHLYNASNDIQEVLEITKLAKILNLYEVKV